MIAVTVRNLVKYYKIRKRSPGIISAVSSFIKSKDETVRAVDGISFDIKQGELVGFIGPNGAGKTTTLKCLSGLLYPTSGKIDILGFTPFERKADYLKNISLVMGQKNQLVWDLPSIETYRLNKSIYDIDDKIYTKNLQELAELLDVENLMNIPVRQLSLGQRMKMELIASLLHNPKILFLDEPTIGLDVVMQEKIRNFIAEYNRKYNSTVLLTSHYMNDVKKLCKRVIVINRGLLIYDGSLNDLTEKYSDHKIVTFACNENINRKYIESLGKIMSNEKHRIVMNISRDNVNKAVSGILNKYKIEDLNIEEPEIDDIIRIVFAKGKNG
jgi:ABC-2 type transport system ATP-binding protein